MKERGLKCELLGMKLYRKTAQLHHLKPGVYDNLDLDNFKLLSPFSHQLVEVLAPLIRGNTTKVPRVDLLMAWIGEFLPEPERTVEKYYEELRRKG